MKKIIFLIFLILVSLDVQSKSGSMTLLAVSTGDNLSQTGTTADLYLEIKEGFGRVFIDSFPLSKVDTQISTRFGKEVACNFLEVDCSRYDFFYTIRSKSALVGGPSASAATTILTVSVLDDLNLNHGASITGTINSGGIIGPVGGILPKLEAASKAGLTKILIPKYSQVNISDIEKYEEEYNLEVIEVSQLSDAVYHMTGKRYQNNLSIDVSITYLQTMREISEQLCTRASILADELELPPNSTALNLLSKGLIALNSTEYYSAASYCFGSNLNLRYFVLQNEQLSDQTLLEIISNTRDNVNEFRNFTERQPLKTITDLETYMVVNDRLQESKQHLDNALLELTLNNTNNSVYQLGAGIERLNSAQSWSIFFGKPGRQFDINKDELDKSCLKKISEVEERIQYIELYFPDATEESRKAVKESYEDYYNGNPELCLYKSSIAKAGVDLVLNNMAVDISQIDNIIEERIQLVRNTIARQTQRDIFPILGYSYFEYANSLKFNDKYSALLYLEYAQELSSLDIYFERKKLPFPRIYTDYLITFIGGLSTGIALGMLIMLRKRR